MTMAMKLKEREEFAVLADRISAIRELKNDLTHERLISAFHLEEEQLTQILSMLDKYPDKDSWDIAEEIMLNPVE